MYFPLFVCFQRGTHELKQFSWYILQDVIKGIVASTIRSRDPDAACIVQDSSHTIVLHHTQQELLRPDTIDDDVQVARGAYQLDPNSFAKVITSWYAGFDPQARLRHASSNKTPIRCECIMSQVTKHPFNVTLQFWRHNIDLPSCKFTMKAKGDMGGLEFSHFVYTQTVGVHATAIVSSFSLEGQLLP